MANVFAGLLSLVFAVVADDVAIGVELGHVFVALMETFCDRSQQPRRRKHTKPSNRSDQPVGTK